MRKLFVFMIYVLVLRFCGTVPPDMTGKFIRLSSDPNFSAPITNITVPVGREGVLTCVVHDLVSYKVAWLRVDTQTILTIQNHVITKNHRISITHTENRIWQLRIKDVKESDQGWYMCQINTDPMKSQLGYLDVVVPPDIIDYETSHDMVVEEGQNVTLTCSAFGLPEPTIEWRREGKKPLMSIGSEEIFTIKGSKLMLRHANRHHMGAYLCIASNGVPPTVSKRVILIVKFPPAIWVRQEIVYASFGQKVVLECITDSHPNSVNYWLHGKDFVQGGSYKSEMKENVFRVTMQLVIRPTESTDFGAYKCVARNAVGEAEKTIHLHHKTKSSESKTYLPASQIGNTNTPNDDSWGSDNLSTASCSISIEMHKYFTIIVFTYIIFSQYLS